MTSGGESNKLHNNTESLSCNNSENSSRSKTNSEESLTLHHVPKVIKVRNGGIIFN